MLTILTKPIGALLAPGQNKASENAQNNNARKDRVESSGDRFDFSQVTNNVANQAVSPKPVDVIEKILPVAVEMAQPVVTQPAVETPVRPITPAASRAEQPAAEPARSTLQRDEVPADLNAEEHARAHALKAMAQERLLNLVAEVVPAAKDSAQTKPAAPAAAKVELRA